MRERARARALDGKGCVNGKRSAARGRWRGKARQGAEGHDEKGGGYILLTVISILHERGTGEREGRMREREKYNPLYMHAGITRAPRWETWMCARGPLAPQAPYTYSN